MNKLHVSLSMSELCLLTAAILSLPSLSHLSLSCALGDADPDAAQTNLSLPYP